MTQMDFDPIWNIVASADDDQKPTAHAKLVVTISPQVELMLVTAMLVTSGLSPGPYGTIDHPIAQDARSWFTQFADHPAVKTVRQLFYIEEVSGFACDAITSFILRRSEPPDLAVRHSPSRSALGRANGDSRVLDRLADQLRDFYHCSRFKTFLDEHAEAYQAIKDRVAGFISA
jgi:hypothetical protein